jgi:L-alanine-DL-glutamate epimerase-like enolase superfamily enzyme
MRIVALAPDLADRSHLASALGDEVTFVPVAALLPAAAAGVDVVVVDLTRAGVLDVLVDVIAVAGRVVAFGPHVDTDLLAAATAAGAEVLPRSRFFRDVAAAVR